jgi:hypothetical protein
MIDRRLHAAVTLALALGVAYLGLARHFGGDRMQEPIEAARRDGERHAGPLLTRTGAREASATTPGDSVVSTAVLRRALDAIGSSEPAPAVAANDGALARARRTLDDRLQSGPADPGEAARIERAVRPLLTPAVLGEAVAELQCNATMCRVDLIAEDDARVDRASNALSERVPKVFSSAVAYPDGAGHKSLYLGTSADDLKLSPEPYQAPDVVLRNTQASP